MKHLKNIVRPYIVWAAIMIVIPLLLTILYAFTVNGNNLVNIKFTLDNFRRFSDSVYGSVFIKSFKLGIYTTVICFLLGYPLAYGITKFKESVQNILILFVTIPMWINMLLRTYAWISILSQNGLFNMFIESGFIGTTAYLIAAVLLIKHTEGNHFYFPLIGFIYMMLLLSTIEVTFTTYFTAIMIMLLLSDKNKKRKKYYYYEKGRNNHCS